MPTDWEPCPGNIQADRGPGIGDRGSGTRAVGPSMAWEPRSPDGPTLAYQPHLTMAAPLVRPAPKATKRRLSPGRTLPSSMASHRAMGMEAAEVLPYLSMSM